LNLNLTYTPAQEDIFFGNNAKYLVVTKGRRLGATMGASNAFIEYAAEGLTPLLWVDTINGNIDRYFDRYFYPTLKQLPDNKWKFNRQKRELKLFDSIIDFRSADTPESIEGFGYKRIFLNEAGIILKDEYLYKNAILPMLLDYSDSQLIAAGEPKGKIKKDGTPHTFHTLYQAAKAGVDNYAVLEYTSYDNPFLKAADIKEMEDIMLDPNIIKQEILGQFIEMDAINPFFFQFKEHKHVSPEAVFQQNKQLIIIVDFNINPFCVIYAHRWRDAAGEHCHVFDEDEIDNGSIQRMIEVISMKYGASLHACMLTGDKMGDKRSIEQRDNASNYTLLQRGLNLHPSQVKTYPNPTHENSRSDCNYILHHHPDFKVHPNCKGTIRDFKIVQCDSNGSIMKSNRNKVSQRADFGDNIRYLVNGTLVDWIKIHSKGYKR